MNVFGFYNIYIQVLHTCDMINWIGFVYLFIVLGLCWFMLRLHGEC